MACYVGIDPSHRRGHATVALDDQFKPLAAELCATPERVRALIESLPTGRRCVGIDAPRTMPTKAREWFFSAARGRWRRGDGQKGQGRHCEVAVVAVAGAKAQWSQHDGEIPGWMQLGMQLFRDLADVVDEMHEVFPTASWTQYSSEPFVSITLPGGAFAQKKFIPDFLDAWVAARTVRDYVVGLGCAVGGGDGFGEIVLPRKVPNHPVLRYPGQRTDSSNPPIRQ